MPHIYTIYKATNKVNGKCYVGFDSDWPNRQIEHIKNSFNKNAIDHYVHFHNAIRKYGPDSFIWEVVYQAQGDKELGKWVLNEIEPHFIQEFRTHKFTENHWGYNMTLGGEGIIGLRHSEETKRKMSASHKNKHHKLDSTWAITFPDNTTKIVSNLREFAIKSNLDYSALWKVSKGLRKHHKEFKVQELLCPAPL